MAVRTCSECGKPLASKSVTAKTCTNACRLKRSRRIRRANVEVQDFAERNNAGAQEIAAIVRREAPDVITRVMKTELAPIVREALTEDVLRAINTLVGLTPRAVQALMEDLESTDATIRQRAYTLLIKYTVGHPALIKADDSAGQGQMVVNFNLPRPEAPDPAEPAATEDAVALRTCDMCAEDKPEDEFVAGSARCQACFEAWRANIVEQFT